VRANASRLRRSLRACTIDGTLHASMLGFGEVYFSAFGLLLGASPLQVGLLTTLPILLGSAFQVVSPFAAQRLGNKRWVVASALLQACTFVPMIALTWHAAGGYLWLLGWVALYWVLALGINPPWNAWMARMIPAHVRSRYFGRRNGSIHAMFFLPVLIGGLLIHLASLSPSGAAVGFAASFAIAALARLGSAYFLSRQHDPGTRVAAERVPLRELLAGLRRQPYGRLILVVALMHGSVHISAAYFTPYMLQGLDLSYAAFTGLTGAVVLARVAASPYWGEMARFYGNRRAFQVAAVLLVPLSGMWVLGDHYLYLIGLQLFAGFSWAGFELMTILVFFDCTDDRNRAQVLSLYTLVNGVAIVVASLIGGSILRAIGGDNGYWTIFLLSSASRAVVVWCLVRGFAVRDLPWQHSFRDVFVGIISMRPGQGPG
jgi:MFS family permease